MKLRCYQQNALNDIYKWWSKNFGHLCVELPTGSGKSHVIASLCKDIVSKWRDQKILMLAPSKELIEQNLEKLQQHWPNAPVGVFSASLKQKNLSEPITFGSIQSLANAMKFMPKIDLVIVDECHLISHKDEGNYRKLIRSLKYLNQNLAVIGFTATPYRLGHGYIDEGEDALFSDIIKPTNINELIDLGYLASLKSKVTETCYELEGVAKRNNEYIDGQLQIAVDTDEKNEVIVNEVIAKAGDRKSWLFFCVGIKHAENVKNVLISKGISAEVITGKTPKDEREIILNDFKSGKIQALTNANLLTAGFDHPDLDLIAMLRPTLSASLYVQMAGRGMRLKAHTDHCLVLDFAGNVQKHGPITDVIPPSRSKGDGEAPIRICDNCHEILSASAKTCKECGYIFPIVIKDEKVTLSSHDIMGKEGFKMAVTGWRWSVHVGKESGKEMVKIVYFGKLNEKPVTEYLTILHDGYARIKAIEILSEILRLSSMSFSVFFKYDDLSEAARYMNVFSKPPEWIKIAKNGKYEKIIDRGWPYE